MHVCGLISRIVYVITCYFQPKMSLLFAFASFFVVEKKLHFFIMSKQSKQPGHIELFSSICYLYYDVFMTSRKKTHGGNFHFPNQTLSSSTFRFAHGIEGQASKGNRSTIPFCAIAYSSFTFSSIPSFLFSIRNWIVFHCTRSESKQLIFSRSASLSVSFCLLRASDSLYVHTNNCIQIVASSGLKCVQIKK